MSLFVWVPVVVVAAAFQTARNGFQRGLLETAGPWGATLVRFLFGLPFTAVWLTVTLFVYSPATPPDVTLRFFAACAIGAAAQVGATAALLVSMDRSSFAVGTAFSQVSLPSSALVGLVLGDHFSAFGWMGLVITTLGLFLLSWPQARMTRKEWSAAFYGTISGAIFGVSSNAFRAAAVMLAPGEPWIGAPVTVFVVQTMQSCGLLVVLATRDRAALAAALASWRQSFGAGLCGAAASAGWFAALAMAPAGAVRAVGVVDMPMAAVAGRRVFGERMSVRQWAGFGLTAFGVIACALGVMRSP